MKKQIDVKSLDKFLTTHPEVVDVIGWKKLLKRYKLPVGFIDKYVKKIKLESKWYYICRFQKLTPEFIKKYESTLSNNGGWFYVSKYQKLSPKFIVENLDKLNPVILENEYFESLPEAIRLMLKQKFQKGLG